MERPHQERPRRTSQVVLDTDVVSFLFKNDSRAEHFLPLLQHHRQIISFMTEAELEQWILQRAWGSARVERFRVFMSRFVVIPSSRDLTVKWAEAMVAARSASRRIEAADAWIAAIALLHDAPLLTHNATDYAGVPGLKVMFAI